MSTDIVPLNDMERLAIAVAKSGLFGMRTSEQALALMAISQAEGTHPALAARDYHIIQGRPTLKADAMLARFQAAGGKVEWHDYTDIKVSATFSHPQGGTVMIDWDMNRARKADLGTKENWKKYPRNMLRARVISEGVRTVYPGVCVGIYTPEEAQDFDDRPAKSEPRDITPKAALAPVAQKSEDDTLLEVARGRAALGTEAFRVWWRTLTKDNKQLLLDHAEGLREIAAQADRENEPQPEEHPEDPFGLPPLPEEHNPPEPLPVEAAGEASSPPPTSPAAPNLEDLLYGVQAAETIARLNSFMKRYQPQIDAMPEALKERLRGAELQRIQELGGGR